MKRLVLTAAGLLALAAPSAALTAAPACEGGICSGRELTSFLEVLQTARSRPVHILQIGDSHTANDNFAGAWRDLLQARYGDAGRGVLPPGRPWAGYAMRQVKVSQGPGWTELSALQARKAGQLDLTFGASDFRLTAPPAGGDLTLTADQGHGFRRFVVCAATGPDAGVLTLTIGGRSASVQLRANKSGAVCSSLTSDEDEDTASVTASGQAVLLSWAAFSGRAGVAVSNLGLPSARLADMGLGGDAALKAEFAAYTPDLIVIAYGTNEGFAPNFSSSDYETVLRSQIARVRRIAPGAPILLLGAPDAQSHLPGLRSNSDQGHAAHASGNGWFSPPALQDVRAIQRRVALEDHVALWDWADRMGGAGAAYAWASARPPLMQPDHVHYTAAGGQRLAERLQDDLDALCHTICG
jgi:lysophospholipase L1-like esterase